MTTESGQLDRCSGHPNCVCSEFPGCHRFIEPFVCSGEVDAEWSRLADVVAKFPQSRVVEQTAERMKAECRTAICRFIDDVEFRFDRAASLIHVRSASRLGRWDLGTNRRRVEALRQAWIEARPSPEINEHVAPATSPRTPSDHAD